ncbi:MAG: hypothetical protein JNL57_02720 [Bacteroidetes bacterium]|nr:hypothetical protein [Bacteroidota bacterium]
MAINIFAIILQNKKNRYERTDFYLFPLEWVVVGKYVDTNQHMNHTLDIKLASKDSSFQFTVSGLFPSSFWKSIDISDTLEKNKNSLLIRIKNGTKQRFVECDSHYWLEDARPVRMR